MVFCALAGCASVQQTLDDAVAAPEPPKPLHQPLGTEDCFMFSNIPFTDMGWPDRFLPPGYNAGDASSVWGLPMNFEFSAAGLVVIGCNGEDAWMLAGTHLLVSPPVVAGVEAAQATTGASPATARDGGYNFYVLEWYADPEFAAPLRAAGWTIHNATVDMDFPAIIDEDVPGVGRTFYATEPIRGSIDDGEPLGQMANTLESVWNHRNFDMRFYHETPDGTGVVTLTMGDTSLLVGRGTCSYRDDSLPHRIYSEMPYLEGQRTRSNGDCPDDTLGALWLGYDGQRAGLEFLPGVFAE